MTKEAQQLVDRTLQTGAVISAGQEWTPLLYLIHANGKETMLLHGMELSSDQKNEAGQVIRTRM
jgi:hypothetical protein